MNKFNFGLSSLIGSVLSSILFTDLVGIKGVGFFGSYISTDKKILFFLIVVAISILFVILGLKKEKEFKSKLLMAKISLIISILSLFLFAVSFIIFVRNKY